MKLSKPSISLAMLLGLGLAACQPDAPPVDEPPEPQVDALAATLHEPLDKARAVEETLREDAEQQEAAIDAAAH